MSSIIIIALVVFVLLIAVSVPISFALSTTSIVALTAQGLPLEIVAQRIFGAANSTPLLALPFYILAGDIMLRGGISKRLIGLMKNLLGWTKSGMAYVTLVTSAFFGAISGSSIATTNTIGGMMYPEMRKCKYPGSFAAAIGASGGILGILIPPSLAFVMFGTQTGTSVSALFKTGMYAGIVICIAFMIASKITIVTDKDDEIIAGGKPTGKELWKSFKDAFWGLMSPVLILGGIYSGIFTATEAAVVAVVYSILVGFLVYRELTWKDLFHCLMESGITSAGMLLLTATSSLFSYVVTTGGLARTLQAALNSSGMGAIIFLLVINIIYLILGMLMDTIPIIVLTSPIFLPLAVSLGVNPVHFGVITVVNLALGLLTPPFGVCVFMSSAYSRVDSSEIFKKELWFLIMGFVALMGITYIPLFF